MAEKWWVQYRAADAAGVADVGAPFRISKDLVITLKGGVLPGNCGAEHGTQTVTSGARNDQTNGL